MLTRVRAGWKSDYSNSKAAANYMLTWPLAGSGLLGAVGAFCLLRPLDPEPQQHLPPEHMQ